LECQQILTQWLSHAYLFATKELRLTLIRLMYQQER